MIPKKVCVAGLGYIGLPTAILLSGHGIDVVGFDISEDAVASVNAGRLHIVEPGLDELLKRAVGQGKLRASQNPEAADAFIIAVPTPFCGDHEPDLSYIEAAAKSIAPVLKKGDLVVLESTSPFGTTEKLSQWLAEARPDLSFPQTAGLEADVQVAHCPERVLPGKVIKEMVENDRIIGGLTTKATDMAAELYGIFATGDMVRTDARTAEMSKLAENSFRDVNIAFANELSKICDRLGINVWELIRLANRHPRVNILKPGCGVGGHCIAVDPWFIVNSAPEEAALIKTAREVNDGKPDYVVECVKSMAGDIAERIGKKQITIACLGLAFKPDIDDLRESPAVKIAAKLADNGYRVLAVEPNIKILPAQLAARGIELKPLGEVLDADIVLLNVLHKEFAANLPEIRKRNLINCVSQ